MAPMKDGFLGQPKRNKIVISTVEQKKMAKPTTATTKPA